jgi:DnaJ-class molecular chaperone
MRERKTGLRATGRRWLNKIKCRTCKGKGKQPSQEQIACTNCKGLGFFEDSNKNDVLCFLCKGQRVIAKNLDVACIDCKGKGHLSKIMQRFSSQKACKKCSGKGMIRCTTKKLTNCNDCDGDGWVYPAQIYSLEDWKKSPICHQVNYSEREVRSSSGSRIIFQECCDCCYYPPKKCRICKGLGKIVEVCPGCIRCDGTGKIEYYDSVECDECKGKGSTTVYIDREV